MELWVILSFLSAIFYSLQTILSKKFLIKKNTSPNQIIFEYGFIAIFFSFVFFSSFIEYNSIIDYWYLYLLKSFLWISIVIYSLKLLEKYDIGLVSPITNLSPIFLLVFSITILNEVLSFIQIIGIFIIIISILFLEITIKHHNKKNPHKHYFNFVKKIKGDFFIWSFIFLIASSSTAIVDKILLKEVSVWSNLYFTSILIFIGTGIYFYRKKTLKKNFLFLIKEPSTLLITISRFLSDIFVLLAIAIPTSLVSLIIPIKRTSTIISSIFGGIMFSEKHLLKKIICVSFSLLGVILIVI